MDREFMHLDLHPSLMRAISDLGFTEQTPIQSAVIPLLLTGKDVIGQSQTGSGKTAAFALPILQNIKLGVGTVQCLILSPTRELAIQVTEAVYELGRYRGVQVLAVYGGQPYDRQIRRLKKGVDIIVGTPGRLLDLIRKKAVKLQHVKTVVLDEADEMLSMGFIEDIESILEETPTARQTALFSATISPAIRQLASRYMQDPQAVTIADQQRTVSSVEQRYYLVNEHDKRAALTRLFEVEEITRALVFARTRLSTNELANELIERGFQVEALHGDLSQNVREQVLNRFRNRQNSILIATDVAARGLDIDDISHVFNYDLPSDPESYVHRVGRTARAGKAGIAVTLLTPREQWQLNRIEKFTRQTITKKTLPSKEQIEKLREDQLQEKMMVWLKRGRCQQERLIVANLVEAGHDPLMIAAAALKMSRLQEKQRPIEPISDVLSPPANRNYRKSRMTNRTTRKNWKTKRKPTKNSREQGMVRLILSAGKKHGITPSDIVGSIAYRANIPGNSIGAIHIEDQHTLVDVPQEYVKQTLAQAGKYKIRRRLVTVEQA